MMEQRDTYVRYAIPQCYAETKWQMGWLHKLKRVIIPWLSTSTPTRMMMIWMTQTNYMVELVLESANRHSSAIGYPTISSHQQDDTAWATLSAWAKSMLCMMPSNDSGPRGNSDCFSNLSHPTNAKSSAQKYFIRQQLLKPSKGCSNEKRSTHSHSDAESLKVLRRMPSSAWLGDPQCLEE